MPRVFTILVSNIKPVTRTVIGRRFDSTFNQDSTTTVHNTFFNCTNRVKNRTRVTNRVLPSIDPQETGNAITGTAMPTGLVKP